MIRRIPFGRNPNANFLATIERDIIIDLSSGRVSIEVSRTEKGKKVISIDFVPKARDYELDLDKEDIDTKVDKVLDGYRIKRY
jgi:hypothetical protein